MGDGEMGVRGWTPGGPLGKLLNLGQLQLVMPKWTRDVTMRRAQRLAERLPSAQHRAAV